LHSDFEVAEADAEILGLCVFYDVHAAAGASAVGFFLLPPTPLPPKASFPGKGFLVLAVLPMTIFDRVNERFFLVTVTNKHLVVLLFVPGFPWTLVPFRFAYQRCSDARQKLIEELGSSFPPSLFVLGWNSISDEYFLFSPSN